MPNEKLKWQQTDTWNIGLEMGLLNGRITARAEYFQKLTKNSLTQVTLAPSLGFGSYPENMGTLENKGVELNFAFIPYQNTAKSAYWTISVNGSHNTDKLKKISEALRHMNEENYNEQGDSPLPHYEEGESINRIWAVKSLGIDPMTGEEILLKRNGKITGEYDVVDLVPCGTTEPKWQGNINSSFAYKGFGVDVSMAYKFGGQVYNQTLVDKVENADLMRNADKRVLDLRWIILTNLVIYMRQVFVLWSNILLKASSGIRVNRMHIIVRHTRNCLSSWLRAGVKTGKMRIYLFIMYSCQVLTVRHGLGSVIASVE